MSAIVHLVAFAVDGVIESAAQDMPSSKDFVERRTENGIEKKPIVKSASGLQRFACGVGPSKWWGIKDEQGTLHVASGEPERVTCDVCKQSKEYLEATGQHATVSAASKPNNQAGQGDQQGSELTGGAEKPLETARPDDAAKAA